MKKAKKMMRGGAAKAKKKPAFMRGGGMAKAKPTMMRGGGKAKKMMRKGGRLKSNDDLWFKKL